MPAKVTTSTSFSEDDQLTHTTLNSLFTNSAFHSTAVDGVTLELSSGAMRLKAAGSGDGVQANHINDDAITLAKMADNSVDSDQYVDGSIDEVHLSDDSIDSDSYVDGSIDEEHLSNDVITGQAALTAVPALTDLMLLSDTDDSGNLKKLDFMKYLPLPRAYGIIKMDGSAGTGDALGLYGCTCSAYSGETYTFNLITDMSSANYPVIAQSHNTSDWGSGQDNSAVEIVDEGQFKIHTHSQSSPYHVSFAVFGTLV